MKFILEKAADCLIGHKLVKLEFASDDDERSEFYGQEISEVFIGQDESEVALYLTFADGEQIIAYSNEVIEVSP